MTYQERERVPGAQVAGAREHEASDAGGHDELSLGWPRSDPLVAGDDDQTESADDREPRSVGCAEWNLGQTPMAWVQYVPASQGEASTEREVVLVDEEPRRDVSGHQAAVAAS